MKKILSLLLALLCVGSIGLMTSCGGDDDDVTPDPEPEPVVEDAVYDFALSTMSPVTVQDPSEVFLPYVTEKLGSFGKITHVNGIVSLQVDGDKREAVEAKLKDMMMNDATNLSALYQKSGLEECVYINCICEGVYYYKYTYPGRAEMLFGTWSCSEQPGYKITITHDVYVENAYACYKATLSTPDSTNVEGYVMIGSNGGDFSSYSTVLYKPTSGKRHVHSFEMQIAFDDELFEKPKCTYNLTSENDVDKKFEDVEFTKE